MKNNRLTAKEKVVWRVKIEVALLTTKFPNMGPEMMASMIGSVLKKNLEEFDIWQRPNRGHK
tara:strand:- start:431 stop:616 length:186 start_codon:yes stop_codon:yes gene_type:complete